MDGSSDKLSARAEAVPSVRDTPVVGRSDGHTWLDFTARWGFVSCRDCGRIRRETNKPCPGVVRVTVRTDIT
jgi:hypothetical protein